MSDTLSGRLSVAADGRIHWQSDKTNPLPGDAVGDIAKGDHILKPVAKAASPELQEALTEALRAHIAVHLEALALLDSLPAETPESVKAIAAKLYDAMGVIPREELETQIAALDPDTRRVVRNLKIKLGPVLVFMPDLNKPAAVKLRAQLWNVFHGLPLPAKVPNDGMVSLKVEDENADKIYYRTIGYPLYGPRAVRIDMLDRVINSIYDNAKDGKFQAKHEMAEWLGASIDDLYKVLEAMGHSKIADAPVVEKVVEEKPAEEKPAEQAAAEAPKVQAKPELATFRLKKGKASQAYVKPERQPRPEHKERPKKDFKRPDKKPAKKPEREPRVMSAGVKEHRPEDSPFAILQQLQVKK